MTTAPAAPVVNYCERDEVEQHGFAAFNPGRHLCVDLPQEDVTISVRTPDGKLVTFAFIPHHDLPGHQCIDICDHTAAPIIAEEVSGKFGSDQLIGRPRQRVICFSGGGPDPFRSESPQAREQKKPVTLTTLLLS